MDLLTQLIIQEGVSWGHLDSPKHMIQGPLWSVLGGIWGVSWDHGLEVYDAAAILGLWSQNIGDYLGCYRGPPKAPLSRALWSL